MKRFEKRITIIRRTKTRKPEDFISVPFSGIVDRVHNGLYGLDDLSTTANMFKEASDPKKYREWKETHMPAMIPAGIWDKLKDGKATHSYAGWSGTHTGFITLDFDDIEDVHALKAKLIALPYVFFCFISPSGKGIKVFVEVNPIPKNREEHKFAWDALKTAVESAIGLEVTVDKQCKNINRLCYLAWDRDAYVNEDADCFKWQMPKATEKKKSDPIDIARDALKFLSADDRKDWIDIGHALKHEGLPFSIWDEWSRTSAKFDPSEDMQARWDGLNPDGTITFGTVVHRAKEAGYKPTKNGKKKSKPKPSFQVEVESKVVILQDADGFNRQINELSDQTLDILIDAGFDKTGIISRSGMIGSVKYSGAAGYNWERLEIPLLSGMLSRRILFMNRKVEKDGDPILTPLTSPPRSIPEDIINYQEHFNLNKFPELKSIWETPFLFDGKLVDKTGLHDASGFYRPDTSACKIERPESSEDALALFKDLFQDFPFATDADFENAMSIPLSLIVRPSFDLTDMVPLFNVNASSPGTGKSELCKALIAIATGKVSESTKLSHDEVEARKALFAKTLTGASYSVFDNIDEGKPLDSAILAGYVSEPVHSDRPLGLSEMRTVENRMLSIFNGNNIEVKFDLVDRGILIALESPPERAHEREFKYPHLIPHILKNRSKYLGALVFMVEKWIDAGMSMSSHQHRMRHWVQVIGGIMEANGFGEHLNANAMDYRREADSESADWARAFSAIYEKYGDKEWAIQDVFQICSFSKSYYDGSSHVPEEGENILGEYIVSKAEDNSRKISLGRLIKSRVGQTLGGCKLVKCTIRQRRVYYKLVDVSKK